jgi:hypothetical protein
MPLWLEYALETLLLTFSGVVLFASGVVLLSTVNKKHAL